ncbi:MAG: nitrile hydratase accessory protein [Solirubrobacteraceae bacterium]
MSGRASNLATVDAAVGDAAPLPRDNGELVFEEPWQGRALGMAVVALDRLGVPWTDFRRHLASAITVRPASQDESPATAYYTAWLDALETLLAPFSAL